MSSESLHCLFEASSSMSFFFRGTNQELVINTELCDLAMTKEEGLIQVGKSRTENNQPSRIDRYTTNVYNQPGIQINIVW